MKRVLWLVLVCLLSVILVLSSCTQNVPEAPPKTETETTTTAVPPTPEPKPASFSVSGLTITPGKVTTGSSVTIEVVITNMGELSGTYDVTLKIDETVEATEKVTLVGGASQKVTFTSTKFTAGKYSVRINGQSGTFVVQPLPPSPPTPSLPPLDAFMKGMHFNDWKSYNAPRYGLYGTGTYQSLVNVAATGANWISVIVSGGQETIASTTIFRNSPATATGANWISVIVSGGQETIASTTIFRNSPATATDAELRRVIDLAHGLGMRVVLLPGVGLSNDPGHWSGQIGTAFTTEAQWQEWFASYREFINHYASFAQEAGVDMLYIGSELGGVTHREDDWRRIVKEVRERFKGLISYDSLGGEFHGETKRIKW